MVALPPSSVNYAQNVTLISYYTMIVSMSMSTGTNNVTTVLTGPSSTVYVSTANIYVVYANYPVFYADGIPGDVFNGGIATPTRRYNRRTAPYSALRIRTAPSAWRRWARCRGRS